MLKLMKTLRYLIPFYPLDHRFLYLIQVGTCERGIVFLKPETVPYISPWNFCLQMGFTLMGMNLNVLIST